MRQALRDLKEAIVSRQPSRLTREDRLVLVVCVWLLITIFGFVQSERAIRGLHHLSNQRVADRKATDRRGCEFVRDHVVKPDRATVYNGPRASVPILRNLGFNERQIRGYLRAQYAPGGPVDVELKRRPIPLCDHGHPYIVPKHATVSTDKLLVLGALNPAVTQQTIKTTVCVRGYTKTIRPPVSYTSRLKRRQLIQYGLPGTTRDYEEDHAIPLELGGNPTSEQNLWPESWAGADQSDPLENRLNDAVCGGAMSLRKAQRAILDFKRRNG
jgi:hypothetical protein